MGLFSAFKGAPSSEKNRESNSWQNLDNLAGSTYGHSEQLYQQGVGEKSDASGYFKRLLTGDRTVMAPQADAATASADAAKRQQGQMGTARGGGAVGNNQQIEDHTRQLISSLLGEAQGGAAGNLAGMGGQDVGNALNALGVASGTYSNLSNLLHSDIKEKNASASKMWSSLISGGLKLATGGFL